MILIDKELQNVQPIRERLLLEMKEGVFADDDRLPRETVLAEELGISRTQLRDTLAAIEQEGYITRRLGIGTLINRHVLNVKSRMDIEAELLDIISNNGYRPEVHFLSAREEKAVGEIAQKLEILEGTTVLVISKVCTADGKPALYFQDFIDKRIIQKEYNEEELKKPVFGFLAEKCNTAAYMDLTRIQAVAADEMVAEILDVPVGTPLLNMDEVDYDIDGNIVFYSRQYFANGMFEQTVLRKRLY
ncbi:MAG: GntR family transcriptional regulator [Lachnospiraceae bacterium]|nr:GntR family transcriptional regulator [Lachnospiraceae bacterium]